jgi:hypothetical protein
MTKQMKRGTGPVKDLAGPVYLVLDKGGPGLRLRLRDGRWLVDAIGARAVSEIVRARERGQGAGGCPGACPSGKTCQAVVNLEVDYFEVPGGSLALRAGARDSSSSAPGSCASAWRPRGRVRQAPARRYPAFGPMYTTSSRTLSGDVNMTW